MKKLLLFVAIASGCGMQLLAQESSVSIKLNEEERFRFEDNRISFLNPGLNVFMGDSSGAFNINGINNVFIGTFSGFKNDGGSMNTYVGYGCGFENTGGVVNTFYGRLTGEKNATGSENTFIGGSAGRFSQTGSYNTYLGRAAGFRNTSGNNNVFIGYFAGAYDTSSNRLIIANSETPDPLIYGEFENKMLRFNAGRIGIRNPLENTIIGDSSCLLAYGNQNVVLGSSAGINLRGGYINTFIGYQAGRADTSGWGNVFIGMRTGWQNISGRLNAFVGTNAGFNNTSGRENVYLGTSAGGSNTTGNFNTCLGRRAGANNLTGSGNVFIGYYAGSNEPGSNKLYIANSDIPEPLIYGDFAQNKLIFHADTVQAAGIVHAAGEIRTDLQYNASGNPGITDTINSVTSVDFAQNKLKYRTIIFNGGIATYVSMESGWADAVGEYFTPCGMISIIGEFSQWSGDHNMTRNPFNPDLWSTTISFTVDDDCHPGECDSIIDVKFRENANWLTNWGSAEFPSGTGIQGGDSIPVPLDTAFNTSVYYVTFNCHTGEYAFENLSGYCPDSITDSRDGKKYATVLIGNQCWMAQDLNVGAMIEGVTSQTDNETIEKYCYNDLESNCAQWGGLYQWPELMDYVTTSGAQGICPAGFHVPTDNEFKILEGNVDSQYGPGSAEWNKTGWRGYDAGYNLRSTEGWTGNGNGSDAFGFHALPNGYLTDYGDGPGFYDNGCCNLYPTSTLELPSNMSLVRYMRVDGGNKIMRFANTLSDGCSLRCLKD